MVIDITQGISSMNFGKIGMWAGGAIFAVLYLGLMCFLGYQAYKFFIVYNQRVLIFQKLSNGWQVVTDRARVLKKKDDRGLSFLYLMKLKKELPPIHRQEYGLFKSLIGRQDCLMLSCHDNFQNLVPVKATFNSPLTLESLNEWNSRLLFINENKRIEDKFKKDDFLSKYGQFLLPIATLVICFMMLLMTLKYVNDISGSANTAAQHLTNAIDAMRNAPPPPRG